MNEREHTDRSPRDGAAPRDWARASVSELIAHFRTDIRVGLSAAAAKANARRFADACPQPDEAQYAWLLRRGAVNAPNRVLSCLTGSWNILLTVQLVLALAMLVFEQFIKYPQYPAVPALIMSILAFALMAGIKFAALGASNSLLQAGLPRCRVLRGGQPVRISCRELVPGDILLLQTGDYVCSRAALIHADGFAVYSTREEEGRTWLSGVERRGAVLFVRSDDGNTRAAAEYRPMTAGERVVRAGDIAAGGEARAVVLDFADWVALAQAQSEKSGREDSSAKTADATSKFVAYLTLIGALVTVLLAVAAGADLIETALICVTAVVVGSYDQFEALAEASLRLGRGQLLRTGYYTKDSAAVDKLNGVNTLVAPRARTYMHDRIVLGELFTASPPFPFKPGRLESDGRGLGIAALSLLAAACSNDVEVSYRADESAEEDGEPSGRASSDARPEREHYAGSPLPVEICDTYRRLGGSMINVKARFVLKQAGMSVGAPINEAPRLRIDLAMLQRDGIYETGAAEDQYSIPLQLFTFEGRRYVITLDDADRTMPHCTQLADLVGVRLDTRDLTPMLADLHTSPMEPAKLAELRARISHGRSRYRQVYALTVTPWDGEISHLLARHNEGGGRPCGLALAALLVFEQRQKTGVVQATSELKGMGVTPVMLCDSAGAAELFFARQAGLMSRYDVHEAVDAEQIAQMDEGYFYSRAPRLTVLGGLDVNLQSRYLSAIGRQKRRALFVAEHVPQLQAANRAALSVCGREGAALPYLCDVTARDLSLGSVLNLFKYSAALRRRVRLAFSLPAAVALFLMLVTAVGLLSRGDFIFPPVQILYLGFICALPCLCALLLCLNTQRIAASRKKLTRKKRASGGSFALRSLALCAALCIGVAAAYLLTPIVASGQGLAADDLRRAGAFAATVLSLVWLVPSLGSAGFIFRTSFKESRFMFAVLGFNVLALLLFAGVAPLAAGLSLVPLPPLGWLLALVCSLIPAAVFEGYKWYGRENE